MSPLLIPFPFRSPWLLSTFTSRKGSFMKVSIILGDRRERSEQREPRMGGNRSERSLPGSVRVTQSRRVSFVLRLTFVSLPYRREGRGMEVIKGEGNTRAEPGETEEGGAVHGKKEPEAGVSAPLLIPRRYAPLRHRPFLSLTLHSHPRSLGSFRYASFTSRSRM